MHITTKGRRRLGAVLGAGLFALAATACQGLGGPTLNKGKILRAGGGRAGVLVVATMGNPASLAEATALIAKSAVAGEEVVVVDPESPGGTVLARSAGPEAPTMRAPTAPVLASDPTSYERAIYARAETTWRNEVATDRRLLAARERAALSRWSGSLTATLDAAPTSNPAAGSAGPGMGAALDDAEGVLLGLRQAGVTTTGHSVIALIGMMGTPPWPVPVFSDELGGTAVVLDGLSGGTATSAAFQGSLLTGGAISVVCSAPGGAAGLAGPIDAVLAGTSRHQTTVSVPFGLDASTLGPEDTALLEAAARLLQTEPGASASVIATGDALGGAVNGPLSAARATSVTAWLTRAGIAPARLVTEGLGATEITPEIDPGQRRALVVIDPAGTAP